VLPLLLSGVAVLPELVPMLPGWLLVPLLLVPVCEPVCVLDPMDPVLPAAPAPAPLPVVCARANVPSESVATKRSFRICLCSPL
jgi:hypothetical protein